MANLIQDLLNDGPVLTDGAWGTQLQRLGLPIGECPEIWNLTHPDRVESVARAYVAAGSRVLLTNSFGGNRLVLGGHGHIKQVDLINHRAVEISREAAGDRAKVFAAMGPSGRALSLGGVTEAELREAFEEQAAALAEAGAAALVIETMSDPVEATIAVRAAVRTGLPVVGCMVFVSGKDRNLSLTGATVVEAVAAMTLAGASAVGANCGQGIAGFITLCQEFKNATDLPIWIKANAGLPEILAGRAVYRTRPEDYADHVPALCEAGVGFLGGCCGTNPEFIRQLRKSIEG